MSILIGLLLVLAIMLWQLTHKRWHPQRGGAADLKIDQLVFNETEINPEIKDRPIWAFQLPLPLENFKPPAKNTSNIVKKEIDYLVKLGQSDTPTTPARKLAEDIETDSQKVYKMYLKYAGENGLMYHEDHLKSVAKDTETLAYLVKSYYNRPRPYQLAYVLGKNIIPVKMAKTSSYPCEHTLTAKVLAYQLSYNNPKHKDNLHAIAKKIELSRYYGGLNFPSDTVASIKLAEILKNRMKYLEASMNAE